MRADMTSMAGGTCPECGHNAQQDRVTVQDALPVIVQFLQITDVSGLLSDDAQTGIAMEQLLVRSLDRLRARYTDD